MRFPILNRQKRLGFFRFQASEEAIAAVANSSWARNLAEAQARLLGFVPGTPDFNDAVNRGARTLAERFLRGVTAPVGPSTPETPARTTRRRQTS